MKVYLTLLFPQNAASGGRLKNWLAKMGGELQVGDALFSFQAGGKYETFPSPASGSLKVTLCREGESLPPGAEIAVLSSSSSQAQDLEKRGLGKILTPDEFQDALAHAEAASIRLPPDQF